MSAPEALNDNRCDVPEEVVQAFVTDLTLLASRLTPEAQARLMGFVHLAEHPDSVRADLEVSASGEVSLVLRHSRGA